MSGVCVQSDTMFIDSSTTKVPFLNIPYDLLHAYKLPLLVKM